MKTIELYSDEIFEAINIGPILSNFNETFGDYVKVEVFNETDTIPKWKFYSNRLLFRKPEDTENYYFGDYHYSLESGFMEGTEHTDEQHSVLLPISVSDSSPADPTNPNSKFKKHFDIFRDTNGEVYIKPNEILKLTNTVDSKFRIRINFLRDLRSTISSVFKSLNNNLIENGNFFAGLEATQTGDLDRSIGKNNFILMQNPGLGKYVLEQDGYGYNNYDMKVTGVESGTTYVFSCWVAWDNNFTAGHALTDFANFVDREGSDVGGTKLDNGTRDLNGITISGLKWHRRFMKIFIPDSPSFDDFIKMNIGLNGNEGYERGTNASGRRYFTDLRLEKLEGSLEDYIRQYLGQGYPVSPTPDNNDLYMRGRKVGRIMSSKGKSSSVRSRKKVLSKNTPKTLSITEKRKKKLEEEEKRLKKQKNKKPTKRGGKY